MNDLELIAKLTEALAKQMRQTIPLSVDLWDVSTIAQYLKRSESSVRERVCCLPDFPKAIRIPAHSGGRGHPLWKAMEVIAWTEKHRER